MNTKSLTEFYVTANDGFDVSYNVKSDDGEMMLVHLTADAKEAKKLNLTFGWEIPDIGMHATWSPIDYHRKAVLPSWDGSVESNEMVSAPVYTVLDYTDRNRETIACSDAANSVKIKAGLYELNANLRCSVEIGVGCAVSHYEADVRIDLRDIPFYEAIADTVKWWESYDGYTPAATPLLATEPLYSAWYSYHQHIDVDSIVDDCAYFSKRGVKVVIVDDGWQTDNENLGYDYCGDWEVSKTKIPSMTEFADRIHALGMKFMIWYSVPFVGEYSKIYEKYKDKTLYCAMGKTYVLDPRYPEIREYLIGQYKNAVINWHLDGLKLDFIDSFRQDETVKAGMDFTSVYDAVDRLMKDILSTLREINPDILIEFRQAYIGPLMRTYGNMFRSGDCPCDSMTNRLNTLNLRLTSGSTAVHSDMIMFNYGESAEQAAYQLSNILFSVPQISVRNTMLTDEQKEMLDAYLELFTRYRDTLLFGKMFWYGYSSNFPYASSTKGETQIGAIYSGMRAVIKHPTEEIVIVNANSDDKIILDLEENGGDYLYTVVDCRGREKKSGLVKLQKGFTVLDGIPENGIITLNRITKQ